MWNLSFLIRVESVPLAVEWQSLNDCLKPEKSGGNILTVGLRKNELRYKAAELWKRKIIDLR